MFEDAPRFRVAALGAKIAEQPRSEEFRFADINHAAIRVEHRVNARPLRGVGPYFLAKIFQRFDADAMCAGRFLVRVEATRAKPVERFRIEQIGSRGDSIRAST